MKSIPHDTSASLSSMNKFWNLVCTPHTRRTQAARWEDRGWLVRGEGGGRQRGGWGGRGGEGTYNRSPRRRCRGGARGDGQGPCRRLRSPATGSPLGPR